MGLISCTWHATSSPSGMSSSSMMSSNAFLMVVVVGHSARLQGSLTDHITFRIFASAISVHIFLYTLHFMSSTNFCMTSLISSVSVHLLKSSIASHSLHQSISASFGFMTPACNHTQEAEGVHFHHYLFLWSLLLPLPLLLMPFCCPGTA